MDNRPLSRDPAEYLSALIRETLDPGVDPDARVSAARTVILQLAGHLEVLQEERRERARIQQAVDRARSSTVVPLFRDRGPALRW